MISSDLPNHLALATEVADIAEGASRLLEKKDLMAKKSTEKGMSFLELKNHLMMDYLTNLGYLMLKKSCGKSIAGDEAIDRICADRTVLEKMRPIEQKLKYQINKAIKVAESKEIDPDDPMNFKANPGNLIGKFGEEDDFDSDEDEEGGDKKSKDGKYVVPKHVPAYFEDDPDGEEKEVEAKKKKQMLSKSLIEELKQQHLDTPEEWHERQVDAVRSKYIQEMKERTRYEEENFVRLPMTKKMKGRSKRKNVSTVASVGDEITSFGMSHFSEDKGTKRKRKAVGGKGKKKKKFRK